MKKVKRLIAAAVILAVLVSGAATVYAMSAEQGKASASARVTPEEYAAEEMAVGAYYQGLYPGQDSEI